MSEYPDDDQYAVVTVVSSHRIRYCVPMSELAKLNDGKPADPSWALDCVTMEDVEEFSQDWLGEQIVDLNLYDQQEVLALFDTDNDYLKDWTEQQKLKHIYDWKAKHK